MVDPEQFEEKGRFARFPAYFRLISGADEAGPGVANTGTRLYDESREFDVVMKS